MNEMKDFIDAYDGKYCAVYDRTVYQGMPHAHYHPDTLSDADLVRELDKLVRIISLLDDDDFRVLLKIYPGLAYTSILEEIRKRLAARSEH